MNTAEILFMQLKRTIQKAIETKPEAKGAAIAEVILYIDCKKNCITKAKALTDKGNFEIAI